MVEGGGIVHTRWWWWGGAAFGCASGGGGLRPKKAKTELLGLGFGHVVRNCGGVRWWKVVG
jgi:hypothetical protein